MLKRIWLFYYDGFKSMTLGKTLWIIVAIKLFIMFFILRLFFFKPELAKYDTTQEKSKHVIENLTK
jgi:Na+/H+ antiporter NhaD/arsenite permease-like protein